MNAFRVKFTNILASVFLVTFFLVGTLAPIAQAQDAETPPDGPVETSTEPAGTDNGQAGVATAARDLGLQDFNATIFQITSFLGYALTWIGGNLLDVSAGVFTIHMYSTAAALGIAANDNSPGAIESLWSVVRDLFNLLFIFGLIYAGFKTILGVDDNGARRMISGIIIAALLINFSLYVAQLAVDFTSILSYQISNLVAAEAQGNIFGQTYPRISDGFVNLSGIESTTDGEGSRGIIGSGLFNGDINQPQTAFVLGLLFLIFYAILGFVFAAGAVILFTRFLALIVLMIFSPFMFIGMVFPFFRELGKSWSKYFVGQLIVGPAYLFMIYVSLYTMQNMISAQTDITLIGMIFQLLIVVGLLCASLVVAKKAGAFGANRAINIGQNIGRWGRGVAGRAAGGATFGLAAAGGRGLIGRRAANLADSEELKDAAAQRGLGGLVARRQLAISRRLADSSFDARKIGGVGNKLGIGEGRKGGVTTITKEIEEREKKYAEGLGTVKDEDPRVASLQLEVDATEQAIKDRKEQIQELRRSLAGTTNENERRDINAKIESHKAVVDDLNEKKDKQVEDLTAEKQRRQLGSRTNIPKGLSGLIKDEKTNLKQHLTEYASERARLDADEKKPDDQKLTAQQRADIEKQLEEIRGYIAESKKKIADAEQESNELAGGYATKVEHTNRIVNIIQERSKEQNKNAADEIRKEYMKKVKSKDK